MVALLRCVTQYHTHHHSDLVNNMADSAVPRLMKFTRRTALSCLHRLSKCTISMSTQHTTPRTVYKPAQTTSEHCPSVGSWCALYHHLRTVPPSAHCTTICALYHQVQPSIPPPLTRASVTPLKTLGSLSTDILLCAEALPDTRLGHGRRQRCRALLHTSPL
jgi:hypothetical protein